MDKKFRCNRCEDTGEVLVSYVPRYEDCPVCNGTTIPQPPKKAKA